MSGFFDYNGDGVVNQQDDIDYWDDDYYARTHHIGMYADTFLYDEDEEDDDEDEEDDDFFGSHDYDDDYDDDSDSDDFDDDDF